MPKMTSLGNPSLVAIQRKMSRLSVQQIQSIRGADPEVMPAVGIDIIDGIIAQTVLARLMDIM